MSDLSQLLPVSKAQFSGEEQLCVNMRNVHDALGVGRDYSTWIKDRIAKYGFEEHVDYEKFANQLDQNATADALPNFGEPIGAGVVEYINGGEHWQGRIDYYFTLDAAKEIAMVENNDRGREIRKYFIACEKQLRKALPDFSDPVAAARAWADAEEAKRKAQLEAQAARTALSQKSAALAELLNDWGEGETFHSVIAESKRICKYYNVKYASDPGETVYKNLGKLMTKLCNGGYSSNGNGLTKDERFVGHWFPWKRESRPSSMFNAWNVYHVDAWAYLYEVIERDGAASLPYVGKFAK